MLPEPLLALLALLVSPGPTNTLMILAGAERGARGVVPLAGVTVAAYLLTVAPLTLAAAALAGQPGLRAGVTVVAGLWVARLALGLWRHPAPDAVPAAVTAGQVFMTTLLNPKALIFGLVLLPQVADRAAGLAFLAAAVAVASSLWGLAGALAAGRTAALPVIRRGSALVLAVFAALLLMRGSGLA